MNRLLSSFVYAMLIAVSFAGSPVRASVIDFDDPVSTTNLFAQLSPSFSVGGLTFTASAGFGAVWSNNPNGNATNAMIYSGQDTSNFVITRTGGGLFDLNSLAMSISWYDQNATEPVVINGNGLSLLQGMQTYSLGLLGVASVNISGIANLSVDPVIGNGSGYWLLDNVDFTLNNSNNVPESGSLALVGLALAGLAAFRRRLPNA